MRIPYQFSRMVEQVIQRTVVSGAAPAGVIASYGGSTAPGGWLLCDGGAVSRSTYAALFTAIGTNYGTGDGSTTFNVPNLKGRVPVGRDASDGSFDALAETGGAKTVTLAATDIPSLTGTVSNEAAHTHTVSGEAAHTHGSTGAGSAHSHGAGTGTTIIHGGGEGSAYMDNAGAFGPYNSAANTGTEGAHTNSTGAGDSHSHTAGGGSSHTHTVTTPASSTNPSVLQPYVVVNFIIKV